MEIETVDAHTWSVHLRLAQVNNKDVFWDVGRAHAENRRYVTLDPALPFVTMGHGDFKNFSRAFLS